MRESKSKAPANTTNRKNETFTILLQQADAALLRDIMKLMNRIERALIPSQSLIHDPISDQLSAFTRRLQRGLVFTDVGNFEKDAVLKAHSKNSESIVRKIDWDKFCKELKDAISFGAPGYEFPPAVADEINAERMVHEDRLQKALKKEKSRQLQLRNDQPVMPGKWRKEAFSRRVYDRVSNYVVTNAISEEEGKELLKQLNTPLQGYVGQAYNFDDHGLTEEWMTTFRDKQTTKPSDDDVIRTHVVGLMEIMIAQIQDRVCNEAKVLDKPPLVLGQDIKEVPVWGIDCYTRKMIELAIEDNVETHLRSPLTITSFIEKRLLPAINAQPPTVAHNMSAALEYLCQQPTLNQREKKYCDAVLKMIDEYGIDSFKIHPKGTGVVCINPNGIPAHVLVTEYLGEIYPSYRWCEKLDVVEQAQNKFELKPTLPDFYNILLERPRQDPDGYGLLYVDASQRANVGSSCSHSCDSNCTSAVVARDGKLAIVLTTNRKIFYGEELTMDYYSITTSDIEWRAAVCLCGMSSCRGSFLHYATQDELQQVLNQNCGPLWRYASLLRSCSTLPITDSDRSVLAHHGIRKAILGPSPPLWVEKYASDILRFIEYERKALPCALMRSKDGSPSHYTYSSADMDARCVMEQRIQSMVCCFSMVDRVISSPHQTMKGAKPLVALSVGEVIGELYDKIKIIPSLMTTHLLGPLKNADNDKLGKVKQVEEAIQAIQKLLEEAPRGLVKLREIALGIRQELLKIENCSNAKARLGQLADILVLWAHTSNFSVPQQFDEIDSQPITVTARELGTNIPRNKIFKAYTNDDRKRSSRLHPSKPTASNGSMSVNSDPEDTSVEGNVAAEQGATASNDIEMTVDSEPITAPSPLNLLENLGTTDSEVPSSPTAGELDASDSGSDPVASIAENLPTKTSSSRDYYLSPNEPVFLGSKKYSPLFCFWQLIGWFNAGTDDKVGAPDLFGCVQLPEPAACFGVSESTYGPKQRERLIEIIRDEKLHGLSWPDFLKSTFSPIQNSKVVYGSPFLDASLGQVHAIYNLIKEFNISEGLKGARPTKGKSSRAENGNSKASKGKKASSTSNNQVNDNDAVQLDNILPPEMPTNWVQCESCKKWRRVPWHVDADSLPDEWVCSQNVWDPESATCDAPQDGYDPQVENTLEFGKSEKFNSLESFQIGQWRDVYCIKNLVYYEGQIKKIKIPKKETDKAKILFHYKGWSPKFDEWIEFDSDRIQPHNMFTNPEVKDPRQQEAYQGLSPIKATIRSAFAMTSGTKKRKSTDGSSGSASKNRKADVPATAES